MFANVQRPCRLVTVVILSSIYAEIFPPIAVYPHVVINSIASFDSCGKKGWRFSWSPRKLVNAVKQLFKKKNYGNGLK